VVLRRIRDTPARLRIPDMPVRFAAGMPRRSNGGRPSKGDRDLLVTRPARPLGDVVRARADEAGLTISEYVAVVLAHAHGMPEHAPATLGARPQTELPLKSA
jgi:hypothetical protein